MSESNKGFYSAATFLGQHFRISKGILKETACMAQEQRVMIADLRAIEKVWLFLDDVDSLSINDLIDKIVIPFVANEGFANWQRDVVTDMAIKKGDTTKGSTWKSKKDKDADIF